MEKLPLPLCTLHLHPLLVLESYQKPQARKSQKRPRLRDRKVIGYPKSHSSPLQHYPAGYYENFDRDAANNVHNILFPELHLA